MPRAHCVYTDARMPTRMHECVPLYRVSHQLEVSVYSLANLIGTSFMGKMLSRCAAYHQDFLLLCLLHDITAAHKVRDVVDIAQARKVAPEVIADNQHQFGSFSRVL